MERLIHTAKVGTATVKVYRDPEGCDEFVCRLVGRPQADYFTNDRDDAIATANAMADRAGDPKGAAKRAAAIWR